MEGSLKDLRFGARTLKRNPGFAAITILVIALGVGANTAIFSVVNAVLLQPLPFKDSDRLVVLSEEMPNTGERMSISFPSFLDWRAQVRSFDAMAGYRSYAGTLTGVDPPARLNGRLVSSGFFEILGVKPLLGRSIGPVLFGVSHLDFLTYAIASGFLILVALFASFVPAARAAGIHPSAVLHQE